MGRKISDRTYSILRSLARMGEYACSKEIAQRLGLTAQQVSNVLFYAHKRGLVSIQKPSTQSSGDEKVIYYSITETGLDCIKKNV